MLKTLHLSNNEHVLEVATQEKKVFLPFFDEP